MAREPGTQVSDRWAAVVLAGGAGRRLGGADKARIEVDGRRLLDQVLAAVDGAAEVVVAGPEVAGAGDVRFVREDPPGGGPVAGLAAGVAALATDAPLVAVLAVDMPRLTGATLARLRAAVAPGLDGAFLVGPDGRRQLAGVLRRTSLERVLPTPAEAHGRALHRTLAGLRLSDVPAAGDEAADVDTWDDLEHLRDP